MRVIPIPAFFAAAIASGALAFYQLNRRNLARVQSAIAKATPLLQGGQHDEALMLLMAALPHARREPTHRAMLLYMIGTAQRARGELDAAVATMKDAAASGHPIHASRILGELANIYALRGELELARSTLDKARAGVGFAGFSDIAQLIEAIIVLRSGDPARAAQLIQDAEPRLERVLSIRQMKTTYLLLAFALASDGRTRDSGAAVQALTRARGIESPARLTGSWPELQTFVETALGG
jgi:tetratricopeptide (TPR) repeat protein